MNLGTWPFELRGSSGDDRGFRYPVLAPGALCNEVSQLLLQGLRDSDLLRCILGDYPIDSACDMDGCRKIRSGDSRGHQSKRGMM